MQEENEYKKVLCGNPHCRFKYVLEGDIHPTGMCGACCVRYDTFTCPVCWYDEEFDN